MYGGTTLYDPFGQRKESLSQHGSVNNVFKFCNIYIIIYILPLIPRKDQ